MEAAVSNQVDSVRFLDGKSKKLIVSLVVLPDFFELIFYSIVNPA